MGGLPAQAAILRFFGCCGEQGGDTFKAVAYRGDEPMRTDEFETDAALARLARNNVVGLSDMAGRGLDLKEFAFRRFMKVCRPGGSEAQARRFFESSMLGILKDGRLTINFKAFKLFGNGNEPTRFLNIFERERQPTRNPATLKYHTDRNNVEMAFADYGGRSRGIEHSKAMRDTRRRVAHYGATGMNRVGLPTSRDFRPELRPRYGALDFAYCRGGGAGCNDYGKSFVILKEHVKHASTYIYTDTFKVAQDLANRRDEFGGKLLTLRDATATYFQLEKILLYCTADMLMQIYSYASGKRARGSQFALPPDATAYKVNYIEFHAHTDVRFDRDVSGMVISRSEIENTFLGLPWNSMERHIREFAQSNGIRIGFSR